MNNELEIIRHSTAHVLAQALDELFPGTKFAIGPATEQGFFYDFLPTRNIRKEDLPAIEERMHDIVKRDLAIKHYEMPKDEARKMYADNPFKNDIIDQIPEETVGIAQQGEFKDLCRGGHVDSTGQLKHFKLLGISGSYWRGDPENPALQRISGTAFADAKALRTYLKQREEAQKYDHRKLGKEHNLFSFQPEGPGFPFFHPKGQAVLNSLTSFMRTLLRKNNYQEVSTPTMLSKDLWEQSGHYAHYKENMYFSEIDDRVFAIKPMNCPGMFLIYNSKPRSYRELPLRLTEFGKVHRHELSGVLHGLLRVRAFTQDDTHIFCTIDQIKDEILNVLKLIKITLEETGFETITISLATKPEKAMGSDADWDKAIQALKDALKEFGVDFNVKEGEGAFYGPKIEIGIKDSLGREWQCGTIQVDFAQPENFDMTYVAPSGKKERPVVIHHAIYGSLERFFAIALEHHKGKLPFWMAPEQIRILPVTDEHITYGKELQNKLREQGIRVSVDVSSDPLQGKIKSAQKDLIPWMFVIGDDEVANNTVTLRYNSGKQEKHLSIDDITSKIKAALPQTQ